MVTISREKNSLPCETEAIHTDTTPQEETRGDQLRAGARKLRSKATLQLKFSLSYILVIAAVLVLLVLSTAYVVGSTNSPFLYFNF